MSHLVWRTTNSQIDWIGLNSYDGQTLQNDIVQYSFHVHVENSLDEEERDLLDTRVSLSYVSTRACAYIYVGRGR